MANEEYKNLNGITVTAPARPSLVLTLIGLDLNEESTTEIDDTDLASVVKTSFAGPVLDAGEIGMVVRFKPDIEIPLGKVDETWRIELPLLAGQSTKGKFEFTGHITKRGKPKASNDGRSEVAVAVKCNSLLVWTAGS